MKKYVAKLDSKNIAIVIKSPSSTPPPTMFDLWCTVIDPLKSSFLIGHQLAMYNNELTEYKDPNDILKEIL